MSSVRESPGASAPRIPAARRVTPAAAAIRFRPSLSTSHPVSGEGSHIAATWRPITSPTADSS